MVRILHFADAHIDTAAGEGRLDVETGLPVRVMDFLDALDHIVAYAGVDRVDLVLFTGDAYRDRTPTPTYQREWDKRIVAFTNAGIPVLLLVGNHDLSPAAGRAHAIQEFSSLGLERVRVSDKFEFLGPQELWGLPLQVVSLPWVYHKGMRPEAVDEMVNDQALELIDRADPNLPLIMAAHAGVEGAQLGGERMMGLGGEMTLRTGLVRDFRLDYVALGHIHHPQDLWPGGKHPVIYPGSISRVDWGEADESKFCVEVAVERGKSTQVEWCPLPSRRWFDVDVKVEDPGSAMEAVRASLPDPADLDGAMLRVVIHGPKEAVDAVNDDLIRTATPRALERRIIKRPEASLRARLLGDKPVAMMSKDELLSAYFKSIGVDGGEKDELMRLAGDIIAEADQSSTTL